MFLQFYIAKRYLLSKKSHNIINIISAISVAGVMVGTLALIVVLSVFNGFEELVKSLYNTFDPDIKITIKEGKVFNSLQLPKEEIINLPGVINYTEVVEENALLKYKSEQYIVNLKGVNANYLLHNPLDTMIMAGDFILENDGNSYAIMGYLVAYHLGIKIYDFSNPLLFYMPRRTTRAFSTMDQSFNSGSLIPAGVFNVQQEIDSKYVIVPLSFARNLLEYSAEEVTSVEIRLNADANYDIIQEKIAELAGTDFHVKNRYQQQELLYKIMKSEKWAIFLILSFIIIIAAFNVVGSLSMLILDKRKDIAVLFSMGASKRLIKRIFLMEGIFVSITGAIAGLVLGYIICILQIKFHLVSLGEADAFIVPYYPVVLKTDDFFAVFGIVFLIGILSAWYPVSQISKRYLQQRVSEFTKSQ